jgi:hypothetical protein
MQLGGQMEPTPARRGSPGAPDVQAALQEGGDTRALLDVIAHVMESSFATLGEGVVLGTMPAYLERFGAQHARHLMARFVRCEPSSGADAALAPFNLLSQLTATPYLMVRSDSGQATKRLLACEFAGAFAQKSPFTKAMVCQLHRAAYQGAVNAAVAPEEGYDVSLNSRILFGGEHCDFDVVSRMPRSGPGHPWRTVREPTPEEVAAESQAFYTAILGAFLEYLGSLLPPADVEALLHDCLRRSGTTLDAILGEPGEGSLVERVRRRAGVA